MQETHADNGTYYLCPQRNTVLSLSCIWRQMHDHAAFYPMHLTVFGALLGAAHAVAPHLPQQIRATAAAPARPALRPTAGTWVAAAAAVGAGAPACQHHEQTLRQTSEATRKT
eukprot:1138721-Pelagomonas_calceolata.AAC.1